MRHENLCEKTQAQDGGGHTGECVSKSRDPTTILLLFLFLSISFKKYLIILILFIFIFWPRGMWDLSSLTRD